MGEKGAEHRKRTENGTPHFFYKDFDCILQHDLIDEESKMKLAIIFSDNMVLQANKLLRFFGTGKGKIVLTLQGKRYEKISDGEKWALELPPQPYGGPFDIQISLDGEEKTLKNVAFGDVFLCAGQSNMQFTIWEEQNGNPIEDDEKIRYFSSDRAEAHDGQKSADGWKICKKDEVGSWSALGLHIAQGYRAKKDVFVGLVGCFQGASSIRSWIPERALDESVNTPLALRHPDHTNEYSAWNGDAFLYNKTFSPIVPYGFHSVVWYQGESNTSVDEGKIYTELLKRMISAWREDLQDSALPFVVVEICDFDGRNDEAWRAIQRCQQEAANVVENVTTVTSKDVCEHGNIHPSNKEKLAQKIAMVL